MRFHKYAAPLAILMALTTPFTAQAAPKPEFSATMPNLVIEADNHASQTTIVIRNAGGVASAPCHMRLTFEDGRIYSFPVMELAPDAVQYVFPQARDEKPISVRVQVDCDLQVLESNEDDNDVTVRYL